MLRFTVSNFMYVKVILLTVFQSVFNIIECTLLNSFGGQNPVLSDDLIKEEFIRQLQKVGGIHFSWFTRPFKEAMKPSEKRSNNINLCSQDRTKIPKAFYINSLLLTKHSEFELCCDTSLMFYLPICDALNLRWKRVNFAEEKVKYVLSYWIKYHSHFAKYQNLFFWRT